MSSSPVFLDTNGWIAQVDKQEKNHREAIRLWEEIGRQRRSVVMTDWVIAEAGNGLAKAPYRSSFLSLLRDFLDYPQTRLVFITEELLDRSVALYSNRLDKAWGLVDCASFLVMGDLGIRDALTADRHFEQAGFRCLLGG